jgi:hypothetical protein
VAGGKWSVRILAGGAAGAPAAAAAVPLQPVVVPAEPKLAAPATGSSADAAGQRAARCDALFAELGLAAPEKHQHAACVASEVRPSSPPNIERLAKND